MEVQPLSILPLNNVPIRHRYVYPGDRSPNDFQPRSMHHFCLEEHRGRRGGALSGSDNLMGLDTTNLTMHAALGKTHQLGRRAVVLPRVNFGLDEAPVESSLSDKTIHSAKAQTDNNLESTSFAVFNVGVNETALLQGHSLVNTDQVSSISSTTPETLAALISVGNMSATAPSILPSTDSKSGVPDSPTPIPLLTAPADKSMKVLPASKSSSPLPVYNGPSYLSTEPVLHTSVNTPAPSTVLSPWYTEVAEPPKSFYFPQEITQYLAPLYVPHSKKTSVLDAAARDEEEARLQETIDGDGQSRSATTSLPTSFHPPLPPIPGWLLKLSPSIVPDVIASINVDSGGGSLQGGGDDAHAHKSKTSYLVGEEQEDVTKEEQQLQEDEDLQLADPALLNLVTPSVKDAYESTNYASIMQEISEQRAILQSLKADGVWTNKDHDNDTLCVASVAELPYIDSALAAFENLVAPFRGHVEHTPVDYAVSYAAYCRRKGRLLECRKYLNGACATKPINIEAYWQRALLHLIHKDLHDALADLAVVTRDGRSYKGFRARADIYLEQVCHMLTLIKLAHLYVSIIYGSHFWPHLSPFFSP